MTRLIRGLLIVVVGFVCDLVLAWGSMIWLGVAHGFDARVPAFGYWTTFFLIWALANVVMAWHVTVQLTERTR